MKLKFNSILITVIAIACLSVVTSCETMKDTLGGLGLEDKVKQAAKDWINDAIDKFNVSKSSPILVVEAQQIEDKVVKEEVLSQLKKPAAYKTSQ